MAWIHDIWYVHLVDFWMILFTERLKILRVALIKLVKKFILVIETCFIDSSESEQEMSGIITLLRDIFCMRFIFALFWSDLEL